MELKTTADLKNSIADWYRFPKPSNHFFLTSMSEARRLQGPDMWYLTFYEYKEPKYIYFSSILIPTLSTFVQNSAAKPNVWQSQHKILTVFIQLFPTFQPQAFFIKMNLNKPSH